VKPARYYWLFLARRGPSGLCQKLCRVAAWMR
jgi:hypothetical protein